jgi:hypothetical protein
MVFADQPIVKDQWRKKAEIPEDSGMRREKGSEGVQMSKKSKSKQTRKGCFLTPLSFDPLTHLPKLPSFALAECRRTGKLELRVEIVRLVESLEHTRCQTCKGWHMRAQISLHGADERSSTQITAFPGPVRTQQLRVLDRTRRSIEGPGATTTDAV